MRKVNTPRIPDCVALSVIELRRRAVASRNASPRGSHTERARSRRPRSLAVPADEPGGTELWDAGASQIPARPLSENPGGAALEGIGKRVTGFADAYGVRVTGRDFAVGCRVEGTELVLARFAIAGVDRAVVHAGAATRKKLCVRARFELSTV